MSFFRSFETKIPPNLANSIKPQPQKSMPKGIPIGANLGLVSKDSAITFNKHASIVNTSRVGEINPVQSNSKLDEIHSKLHYDLNKIRTWKLNVDEELKQKTYNLESSSQIIELQRKSILDLQLENEKISLRLKEELDGRKESEKKHHSTRELMFILKEQFGTFQEKLSNCQSLKNTFDEINDKRTKDIENMISKFTQLEIVYTQNMENMNEKYIMQESEKVKMQATFTEQINDAQNQVAKLSDSLELKASDLQKLETELVDLKLVKSTMDKETEDYLSTISVLKDELEEKSVKLNEGIQKVTSLNSEIQQSTFELKEVRDKLNNQLQSHEVLKTEYDAQSKKIDTDTMQWKQENNELLEQLATSKNLFQETEKELLLELKDSVNMIETLKSNTDLLKMSVVEQQKLVQDLQMQNNKIQSEKDDLLEKLANLADNLKDSNEKLLKSLCFEVELIETKKQLQLQIEINEKLKDDLTVAVNNAKMHQECVISMKEDLKHLSDDNNSKNLALKAKETEIEKLNCEYTELANKLSVMEDRESRGLEATENLINELKNSTAECQILREGNSVLDKKLNDCEAEITNLTARLEESVKTFSENKSEISDLQRKLDDTCASQTTKTNETSETISNLENKSKSLKDELTNSTRRVKELEKLNTSLEKKLVAKTKAFAKSSEDANELRKRMSEKNEDVATLKKELKGVNEQLDDYKKKISQFSRDMEECKSSCERKVNEYLQMLGKSEETSNKTIAEKNKQLRQSKQLLEQLQKQTKFEGQVELKKLSDKIEDMKKDNLIAQKKRDEQLLAFEVEKTQLLKQIDTLCKEKQELLGIIANLQNKAKMDSATQKREWETEKEELLAKFNSSKDVQPIYNPQTPIISQNIQSDATKITTETPFNRKSIARAPITPKMNAPAINSNTPTTKMNTPRNIYPSGKTVASTPISKTGPKNIAANVESTPKSSFKFTCSNSYITATPRSTPANYGSSNSFSSVPKINSNITPRVNPDISRNTKENTTPQVTNSSSQGRTMKMTEKKAIPTDLGFDSDTSTESGNSIIKRILDGGLGLKRKSIITKSPYR